MYTVLVIGNCPQILKNTLQQNVQAYENIQAIQFAEEDYDRFHLARKGLYEGNILLVFPEEGVPGLATESFGLTKIPVIVCNIDGKLNSWLDYLQSEDAKLEQHFKIHCFNPGSSPLNQVVALDSKDEVNALSKKIFSVITTMLPQYPKLVTRADDTQPNNTELQELKRSLQAQNHMQFTQQIVKKKPTAAVICAAHPLKTIAFNGYALGEVIGKSGFDFVNGAGGKILGKHDEEQPLMYQTAQGAKNSGSSITGAITPFECLKYEKKNDLSVYDNLIFVNNLSERIKTFSASDVVIVGPGGTGTMDEFWALGCENIIVLNIDGFYNNLKKYFDGFVSTKSVQFIESMHQLENILHQFHSVLLQNYQNEPFKVDEKQIKESNIITKSFIASPIHTAQSLPTTKQEETMVLDNNIKI